MESFIGTKKVVKAGSSDAITLTKDIQPLGIAAGDEVSVRIAKPSEENDRILNIVRLIEDGDYDVTNRTWLRLPSRFEYDDPANYIDEESIAVVDDLESIQLIIMDILHRYILSCNTSRLFYYSDELNSFVRTFDRRNKGCDSLSRTVRGKLRFEVLLFDFVYDLLDDIGVEQSPLSETRGLYDSLTKLLSTYSDIIDSYLDDDQLEARVDMFNAEWDNRQEALSKIAGTFIVVIQNYYVTNGRDCDYWEYEVRTVESYSRSLMIHGIENELADEASIDDNYVFNFRTFGPLDEDSAERFAEYLRMGIKLNMSRSDVVEVFDWCEDQYQNFLQTLEGDDE